MCGIAGVRRFGGPPITGEELVLLLCDLEHRGQHATGVALENPDGIKVLKMAKPAAFFTRSEEFETFIDENLTDDTRTALLHTRWATVGNPLVNENNHPMFDGGTAVVHNGHIANHWFLFQDKDYERSCETDSDIIRAIVAKHGITEKGVRELCKMNGSAAIAVLSEETPDHLLLARSGSPLTYGFTDDGQKLYWASEAHAIIKAAKPWKKVHGIWVQNTRANVSIGNMPDNTAWVIGPDNLEFHQEFTVCPSGSYRRPDYSKGRESYHAKTKGWKHDQKAKQRMREAVTAITTPVTPTKPPEVIDTLKGAIATCGGCGRGVHNPNGVPWTRLTCPHCKAKLG